MASPPKAERFLDRTIQKIIAAFEFLSGVRPHGLSAVRQYDVQGTAAVARERESARDNRRLTNARSAGHTTRHSRMRQTLPRAVPDVSVQIIPVRGAVQGRHCQFSIPPDASTPEGGEARRSLPHVMR